MTTSPSVAACLIVRNGESTIERCIHSVRPYVDEICILDTGSTDRTLDLLAELANSPGAPIRIERAKWRDDYAAARNASFEMSDADYLLWLDDDEWLEGSELRDELETAPDVLLVQRLEVWARDGIKSEFRHRVIRRELAHWKGRIHEYIPLSRDWTLHAVPPSCARVIHLPQHVRGRHAHRPLVEAELATAPSPQLWLYKGRHLLLDDRDPAAASEAFENAVANPDPDWSDLAFVEQAWRYLAHCRRLLGDVIGASVAASAAAATTRRITQDVGEIRARVDALDHITDDDPVWAHCDEAMFSVCDDATFL